MNIGQLSDTFLPVVDGVGRVVLAYAQTLCSMGHHVTVSCPMHNTGYRGKLPFEIVDYLAMRVPTAPQYRTGPATLDNHYRQRIDMIDLDIVHTHSPFSAGTEALRLSKERHIPLVASFHSKYYDDFYKATKSKSLSKILLNNVVRFYNRCDEVWAVSETTAEVLRGYGYDGEIFVMPNGVTIRQAKPDKVAELDQRFKLGGLPLLLFVGQMNWKKNILRILESAALLKQEGTAFQLILAGQGPDEKKISAKIEEFGLSDRARLIGHVSIQEDLDALYQRASLLVFPSLYDNAPMVVREAAVMETPAVLVKGSSSAEIVRDGFNGFLCEDDSQDLCRVLSRALKSPENLQTIGQNARNSIPVSWDDILGTAIVRYENLVDFYKMNKRRPSRRQLRLARQALKEKP